MLWEELCTKLMQAAVDGGAELKIGTVQGVEKEAAKEDGAGDGRISHVKVDGELIPCKSFVCTMGPWAALAQDWLDFPVPMAGPTRTEFVAVATWRQLFLFPAACLPYASAPYARRPLRAPLTCVPFEQTCGKVPMTGIKSTSIVFKDDTKEVEPFALVCAAEPSHIQIHTPQLAYNITHVYTCTYILHMHIHMNLALTCAAPIVHPTSMRPPTANFPRTSPYLRVRATVETRGLRPIATLSPSHAASDLHSPAIVLW